MELRCLKGHSSSVGSALFSPDGKLVVTASLDQTARIWDAATGTELRCLEGHGDFVSSAVFSPDGRLVATASDMLDDKTARIWDATTGKELHCLGGHSRPVQSAVFSPDGKFVVTASSDNTSRIWDAATGWEVRRMRHGSPVISAVFSPDGKSILTTTIFDRAAHIWVNPDDKSNPLVAAKTKKPEHEPKKEAKKEFTNSIGMKFVLIPAGEFMMGSPESEAERGSHETRHKVRITKAFYMQTTEVTQAQWKAVMGSNPSYFKNDNLPVEQVRWHDIQEFIRKLNRKEGVTYCLPTEAEWEYACRAGTTTPFHFGSTITTSQVNYNANFPYGNAPKGVYRRKTTPVGSFNSNK